MGMTTRESRLVFRSQVDVNEVIFQENFELVLIETSRPFLFLLVEVEVEVNSLHLLDSKDWNCSKRFVAASDCIASTFEVSEAFLCNLHPSVQVTWVKSCFILNKLSLEEYLVMRVIEVYDFILWWKFHLLFESRSSSSSLISIKSDVNVLLDRLGL